MTTSSGTVVAGSTARYRPFGGYRTQPSQTITERGFTGHLHNDSVGLIYMNARFYLPGVGRFASADTIVPNVVNPQAFNRYSYVLNNPLIYNDPTGHHHDDVVEFSLNVHQLRYLLETTLPDDVIYWNDTLDATVDRAEALGGGIGAGTSALPALFSAPLTAGWSLVALVGLTAGGALVGHGVGEMYIEYTGQTEAAQSFEKFANQLANDFIIDGEFIKATVQDENGNITYEIANTFDFKFTEIDLSVTITTTLQDGRVVVKKYDIGNRAWAYIPDSISKAIEEAGKPTEIIPSDEEEGG